MSEVPVPGLPPARIESRSDLHAAVRSALASAQREILMADASFADWPLNQPDVETILRSFFHASRVNRIRLLTSDASRLGSAAPRLGRVAREFSHAFESRITTVAKGQQWIRGFSLLVVDRSRIVRRFHPDQMRGIAEFNPDEADLWIERFESVWNDSTPGLAATTIGLPA